ncbi:MAG: hypothetical protein KC931_25370, partial [Candidatus Omnitrophica bacterium]|nr:hypothetical protein [Candidatus Omnitrophota bacterium]
MPPPKRSSNLIRNLIIILVAVVPVVVLLGPKFRYQRIIDSLLEYMDEYGRQVWEDMHTVPIDIPDEWLEEHEFPKDLLNLVEEKSDVLNPRNWDYLDQALKDKLEEGVDLSGEERDAIQTFILSQDERIQSVSEIVHHPDYRFGVAALTQPESLL